MTDSLHIKTKALFSLVSTLEPRVKPLAKWFDEVVAKLDRWHQAEGNQGVKRMKDILSRSFSIIIGEDPGAPLAFVKQNGLVPTIAEPLVERCKSITVDAKLLSAVLSLVRVTDLYEGKPTDLVVNNQLLVINGQRVPITGKRIMAEFKTFVKLWFTNVKHPSLIPLREGLVLFPKKFGSKVMQWYRMMSTSMGPNGPLTANSHRDLLTLNECKTSNGKTLIESISDLSAEMVRFSAPGQSANPNWFFPCSVSDYVDALDISPDPLEGGNQDPLPGIPHNHFPGKISFKPEKGGKVRLIAMPDYYTQVIMKPLHNWLMNVLRSFDSDCTFDQRSALPKISKWQNEGRTISSFDQSSCTDLFPIDCQLIVLSEAFDTRLTSALRTVMVDRDWEVKLPSGHTKKVRWSVGQPMGMYASWPLMAVAHHFLVQFAAWRASGKPLNPKPFSDYVICGDDIVIASKSVSDSYFRVVSLLGMKINLSKSHVSGGSTGNQPVSEFAKIIVWKGQPLNPVRPKLVAKMIQDWKYVVTLVQDLRLGVWRVRKDFVSKLIKTYHPSKSKVLEYLLTVPLFLGGFGFRTDVPLRTRLRVGFDTEHIHPWILFMAEIIRQQMLLDKQQVQANATRLVEEVGPQVFRVHPLQMFIQESVGRAHWHDQAFGPGRIPSVREIANSMILNGVGTSDQRLLKEIDLDRPWPVWQTDHLDEEQNQKRVIWDRVVKSHATYDQSLFPALQSVNKSLSEAVINRIEQYLLVKQMAKAK